MAVNALSTSSPLLPTLPDPIGPGSAPGNGGSPPPGVGVGSTTGAGAVPDAKGGPGAPNGSTIGNGGLNGASRFTSAKLTDPSSGQDGSIDETRLQQALAEIRDVASSCIDLLARVMLEQQGMQRHEAVQDRTNMRAMARDALLQAAGELNKQADAMQQAAITQLVVACVSAAVTVGMAGVSAGLNMKGSNEEAQIFANTETKLTSNFTHAGAFASSAGQAAGKLGEAMGSFAGTEGQIAVKQSEAAQKIDEANAQQYEGQADLKKGMQDTLDDNVKQIIQFLKEMKDAVADLQSAITRHAG